MRFYIESGLSLHFTNNVKGKQGRKKVEKAKEREKSKKKGRKKEGR